MDALSGVVWTRSKGGYFDFRTLSARHTLRTELWSYLACLAERRHAPRLVHAAGARLRTRTRALKRNEDGTKEVRRQRLLSHGNVEINDPEEEYFSELYKKAYEELFQAVYGHAHRYAWRRPR